MDPIIFEGAVRDYTTWFTISATLWLAFGIWLSLWGIRAARRQSPRTDAYSGFPAIWIYIVGVGLIFIICNVPTILKPRAWAIHQVLKDSRHHYPAGITITNTP